jgi:hypothetical protein
VDPLAPGQQDEQDLRDMGYHDEDIQAYRAKTTQDLQGLGYGEQQIKDYYGIKEPDMSALKNHVTQNLAKNAPAYERTVQSGQRNPAKGMWQAIESGWDMSTSGLALSGHGPDTVLPPDADTGMRIASGFGQVAGDLPTFFVGNGIAGPAGGFALTAGLRKIMMDHYEKGDITSSSEFVDRLLSTTLEAYKGGIVGAATAGAGTLVGEAGAAVAPVAGPAARLGGEMVTMATVSKGLEGKLPEASDFVDAAIFMGGLHSVGVLAPKLRAIFAQTGESPKAVVEAAEANPILKQELLSDNQGLPIQAQEGKLLNPNFEAEKAAAELKAKEGGGGQPPNEPPKPPEPPSDMSEAEKKIQSKIVDYPEAQKRGFKLSDLTTALGDDLNAIKLVTPDSLPADKDPYILSRNNRDWAGKLERSLKFNTLDAETGKPNGEGLLPILERVPDGNIEGLQRFMVSQRAIEKSGQGINSGFDLEAAKQVVEEGKAKYGEVAQAVVDYQNRIMDYAVKSGILAEQKAGTFDQANQAFIPFLREMDADRLAEGKGGGLLFQKMKGSERNVVNPLQSVFRNSAAIIKASEMNKAKLALVDLPNVEQFAQRAERVGKNTETVMRDGKKELWAFNPDVHDAIKAMDYQPQFIKPWAKMFATPFKVAAKGLRLGILTDPGFAFGHLQRVLGLEVVQSKYPHMPFEGVIQGLGDQWKENSAWQEFLSSGGANGSLERVSKLLDEKPWENKEDLMLNKPWNAIKDGYNLLHRMVEIGDTAPRIAEFKRGGGLNGDLAAKTQAAFDARNLTLDYTRGGAFIKKLQPFIPFVNVDVQGTYRTFENAVSENKGRIFALGTASLTMPTLYNWWMNHDDPRYKEAPDWMRATYWVVPTDKWEKPYDLADVRSRFMPNANGEKVSDPHLTRQLPDGSWEVNNGYTFRIRKPFLMGAIFGTMPEILMNSFVEKNPRALQYVPEIIGKSLVPFGLPTLVAPVVEQTTNHSFFTGNPLVNSASERVLPPYQYTHYTSEVAKQVGKLIGALPPIGPKNAELASPEVVDNYIRAWTGTVGQWTVHLLDKGLHAAGVGKANQGAAPTLSDIPMAQEFLSRFPSVKAQSVENFRDRFELNQRYYNTVQMLAKEGDGDAAKRLATGGPQYMVRLNQMHDTMVQMSQAMSKVDARQDMTPTDKRQLINKLTYMMMSTANLGLIMMDRFDKDVKH